MRIFQITDKIIEYAFYLLFFLVPLILTPWNYELFEFNKMMLTYFLTTIIVAAWLVEMVTEKRFIFRRTVLDIPLILFFTSQLISTFLSIDRHTSLWGYYSRFNGGLFSTMSYLLLYWAYVSHFDKEKTLSAIRYTLYAATLVAAYGIAEHFGIDAKYWKQLVQLRVFSTLGQPNWLAAWLVALMPFGWKAAQKKKGYQSLSLKRIHLIGFFLSFIFYLCLLYTKSRSGLLGFAVIYVVFWVLSAFLTWSQKDFFKRQFLPSFAIVTLLILLVTLVVGTPWTPSAGQLIKKFRPRPTPKPVATVSATPQPPPLITESGDIRKIVWQGAIEIWRHYPIFGTGVETFAYSYYWYRPRAHNDVSEWDFLYNKAHNEYLTILANTGAVGLIAYLGVIGTFMGWTLQEIKSKKAPNLSISQSLNLSLFAGYVSILVTNFFGFSVVPVNLLFFLIPAMAMTLTEAEAEDRQIEKKSLGPKQWLAIGVIILLVLYTIVYLAKFWYADTRFAVAEKLDDAAWYERGYNELQTAIKLHPSEPYYHNEMAYSLAGLATLTKKEDDATLSAQLADLAIAESDRALKISPYHLNFWKKRAKMLILLSSIDPKYQQKALDSLLRAAELAPTDAKIFYNLGILYSHLGQDDTAIKTLEHTIKLKPNYGKARYALALLYEKKGKIKEAREQLKYILEKINPADTRAKRKLKEL